MGRCGGRTDDRGGGAAEAATPRGGYRIRWLRRSSVAVVFLSNCGSSQKMPLLLSTPDTNPSISVPRRRRQKNYGVDTRISATPYDNDAECVFTRYEIDYMYTSYLYVLCNTQYCVKRWPCTGAGFMNR